jgi:hypothetical protein
MSPRRAWSAPERAAAPDTAELDALEQPPKSELDTLLREARHGINRIHTVVRGLMTFRGSSRRIASRSTYC